ncbi:MAG: hypothetical protein WC263_01965 [Candidatus Micrarchaeia archaeon]|jgi:hypothetical protein
MGMEKMAENASALRDISITLDTYDDIFSDFDPRPYSQREMSEDFLKEISRRYMEGKHGRFEVHFIVPSAERDLKAEALIKKRLREQFTFMVKRESDVISKTKSRGYFYMLIGFLILLLDTYFYFYLSYESVFYHLITILLVPAGWYGMFTGIGKVIDEPFDASERKKLHEKFERADFSFMSDDLE